MFKVVLADGTEFSAKGGQSVLSSARDAGVYLSSGCNSGTCGSCNTRLISGVCRDLKSNELTAHDSANSEVLTCQVTPGSHLQISATNLTRLRGINSSVLPCRIDKLDFLSESLVSVEVRLPPTAHFEFIAGQFVNLINAAGISRQYSIATAPREHQQNRLTFLIRRYPDGKLSDYWFKEARVDDLLRLEGPFGTFFLRDSDDLDSCIFLATGTGIAPIRSILHEMQGTGSFQRYKSIRVYFGCRNTDEFFFDASEFLPEFVEFFLILSRSDSTYHRTGYVQHAALEDEPDLKGAGVYACGSSDMINSARKLLLSRGLPANRWFSDAFLSASQYNFNGS